MCGVEIELMWPMNLLSKLTDLILKRQSRLNKLTFELQNCGLELKETAVSVIISDNDLLADPDGVYDDFANICTIDT